MTSRRSKIFISAVAFFVLLIMSSGAQASSLFGLDGNPAPMERQIGLFQQAIQWLNGTWTDLKVTFGEDEASAPPPPSDADDDSGWTIDPDG